MSARRIGSFSSHGPSNSRYSGAVDCRKIALAAVVSLFATTKLTRVAAYASPTGAIFHDHPRRASGRNTTRTIAAIADRKHATCQPLSVIALNAAPPVENSKAA